MGAMQAQEFAMAKWAIGLRLPGSKEAEIDEAFNQGSILRTHLLRPTWHFVSPADIRWMLLITAPRVQALNAHYYRKVELDSKIFKKCNDVFVKVLAGGKHLSRTTLQSVLAKAKIKADGIRLAYIMMQAELDGVICSGRRLGKQFTYALLEERVPPVRKMDKENALSELINRFFASRGPATLSDFTYWSSLTMKEARCGIEMLDKKFSREKVNEQEYFFIPTTMEGEKKDQISFLMPDYDEYGMSYKDRSAILDSKGISQAEIANAGYLHIIVLDGKFGGSWKITRKNKDVTIETYPSTPFNKRKDKALGMAVDRFSSFQQFLNTFHITTIYTK
jgi:hypothetical protein